LKKKHCCLSSVYLLTADHDHDLYFAGIFMQHTYTGERMIITERSRWKWNEWEWMSERVRERWKLTAPQRAFRKFNLGRKWNFNENQMSAVISIGIGWPTAGIVKECQNKFLLNECFLSLFLLSSASFYNYLQYVSQNLIS
jgi:hypothetical protein